MVASDYGARNMRQLIGLLVFIVLVVSAIGLFFWRRAEGGDTRAGEVQAAAQTASKADLVRYQGLRKPKPGELAVAFPQFQGRPFVVEFHSAYCLDCQKLAPVLKKVSQSFQGIPLKTFDVSADRAANPAVFRILSPATVPVLVFVGPDYGIREVLYGEVGQTDLQRQFESLGASAAGGAAAIPPRS